MSVICLIVAKENGGKETPPSGDRANGTQTVPTQNGYSYSTTDSKQKNKESAVHFFSVCNGETSSSKDKSFESTLHEATFQNFPKLSCMYSTGLISEHPFLRIGPFRIEEFSKEPPIILCHDFASSSDIEEILLAADGKVSRKKSRQEEFYLFDASSTLILQMNPAGLIEPRGNRTSVITESSNFRIGDVGWLRQRETPIADKLTKRAGMVK